MSAQNLDRRDTEYSLRCALDNDQPGREGMCLALLPALGPFSECRPRRPKGGPDGKRDIEAKYQGEIEIWGAVGFKNNANSTSVHSREIRKKFKEDLNGAIEEKPELRGFVFLTNVDLTPTMEQELKQHAHSIGNHLTVVEIFDFETLRAALDSVDGLIARLKYLNIPMSKEEQIAFFDRYGTLVSANLIVA